MDEYPDTYAPSVCVTKTTRYLQDTVAQVRFCWASLMTTVCRQFNSIHKNFEGSCRSKKSGSVVLHFNVFIRLMTYSSSTAHAYEVFDNKVFGLRGLHLDGSGSKSQNRRIQIIITKKVAEFSLLDSNREQLAFLLLQK